MRNIKDIRWFKSADTQYQTVAHRGYTGTIDYDAGGGAEKYTLTVTPGPVVTTHVTLGLAKRAFNVFLRDKPV